jgi:geranylgeranyl reductase family protein
LTEKVLDVLVVGAGPGGIAAGIEARRLGLDVVVVDKATFPRDKTCGDGLTTGALRELDALRFDVRGLPSWVAVTDTVLVSPSGREVEVPLPPDGAYAGVVPRAELDAALVHHARSLGVDVREGAGVVALRDHADQDDDAVTVTLTDGTKFRARFVVAADGHYSPVRRMVGDARADDLGSWHAFRQYFTGVDDRRLWVLFEEDFLPGYAWVFPVGDGRANVGFGVLRTADTPNGKALAAQWRGLADRPSLRRALGPRAEPEGSVRAWPIPAAYDRDRLTRGRVLFVGDAASVVDPMTGEGIAQALESGMLAARAVAESRDGHDASEVAARYRSAVDRALGADLRFASLLQQVLRVPIGARAAIRAASLTPWTRRNFARWMWEDYPRAVLFTPRRWHRKMFQPAGAYSLHSSDGPH